MRPHHPMGSKMWALLGIPFKHTGRCAGCEPTTHVTSVHCTTTILLYREYYSIRAHRTLTCFHRYHNICRDTFLALYPSPSLASVLGYETPSASCGYPCMSSEYRLWSCRGIGPYESDDQEERVDTLSVLALVVSGNSASKSACPTNTTRWTMRVHLAIVDDKPMLAPPKDLSFR